jgi:hypothetical protein
VSGTAELSISRISIRYRQVNIYILVVSSGLEPKKVVRAAGSPGIAGYNRSGCTSKSKATNLQPGKKTRSLKQGESS